LYGQRFDAVYGVIPNDVAQFVNDLLITYSQSTGGYASLGANGRLFIVITAHKRCKQLHRHYSCNDNNYYMYYNNDNDNIWS